MLSNPLHRYSTYNTMSSNMFSNSRIPSQNHSQNILHSSGLDHLAHGSQHTLHQLQQNSDLRQRAQRNSTRHRQHLYHGMIGIQSGKTGATHGLNSAGPVRRRISRACDQCNQLRTKCDGQGPCAHCVEFGLGCEYIRERKKRGKASRKDLAQLAAAAAGGAPKSPSGNSSDDRSPSESRAENLSSNNSSTNDTQEIHRSESKPSGSVNDVPEGRIIEHDIGQDPYRTLLSGGRLEIMTGFSQQKQPQMVSHRAGSMTGSMTSDQTDSPMGLGVTGYSALHSYGRSATNMHLLNGSGSSPSYHNAQVNLPGYADLPYSMQSPSNYPGTSTGSFRLDESPIGFSMTESPGLSSSWMSLPSPSPAQYTQHITQQAFSASSSRYPVLQTLIPHLGSIVPASIACDLLDVYFTSSSSAQIHPTSPYILGYVFRKSSFLHPTSPRTCSPALLASMLWVAAQTSDTAFLTAPPSARGRVCQALLELTVSLLKPLIHGPPSGKVSPTFSKTVINGVALGDLRVSIDESSTSEMGTQASTLGAAGTLEDIVAYIHLATVVSASEYKGASLRWWNAAWSLARELKLGRELPPNPAQNGSASNDLDADGENDDEEGFNHDRSSPSNDQPVVGEEEREERRRIWWLLYIVDRHLSLCYNKPLSLLDSECENLLQPMDDSLFQSGNFSLQFSDTRKRGPGFEVTGHSIFGYFLPLMTILGGIVDLKMARNHPRFGTNSPFRSTQEWETQSAGITRQLEAYSRSLVEFEKKHLGPSSQENTARDDISQAGAADLTGEGSVESCHTSSSYITAFAVRTRIVLAYSTHVMHVLHILLTGKWDPISLLDDADLWISSDSFVTSTSHAVSAAEAINGILEWDEGLEFMPFFFGIYLLQGSFLLLLIADKLGVEASGRVIGACEGVVRAIEACVATLSTEYQRNFRKVMRSALAQVRGRCPEDWAEQQKRRREVLLLYRWTGDGTGLAL